MKSILSLVKLQSEVASQHSYVLLISWRGKSY